MKAILENANALLSHPLHVIIGVLALLGLYGLLRTLWSIVVSHIIPAYIQWKLARFKITLPFADLVLDKHWRQPVFFRDRGPKFVDFSRGCVFTRKEVDQLGIILRRRRLAHVVGPPSSGKSVIAFHVAYDALRRNETVLYFSRPNQIPKAFNEILASPFARRLDRPSVLVIVDDAHLDITEASRFFSLVYGALHHMRLLYVSRPITMAHYQSSEEYLPFPFTQYMPKLEVTADEIVGPLANYYSEQRFGHPISPATLNQFTNECANDLLILGRYLTEWDGSTTANMRNIGLKVSSSVQKDLEHARTRCSDAITAFLIVGVFYRFEITVDKALFADLHIAVDSLVHSGDLNEDNGFVSLYHSSLARLYSKVIERTHCAEFAFLSKRFSPFPEMLFRHYVHLRPRNFCELVVGLRKAPGVLGALLADRSLDNDIQWCLENEAEISMLGWALRMMFANSKHDGWRILERADLTKSASKALDSSDGKELTLFLFNMECVSEVKAREWLAAVSPSLIAARLSEMPLREFASTLRRIQKFSQDYVARVINSIDAATALSKFVEEDDFETLCSGLGRLCEVFKGRMDVRVTRQRDFAGEWSTRIALYCDKERRVRFFDGHRFRIPFSSSSLQHLCHCQWLMDNRVPHANITLDEGAVAAIMGRNSLFPAGVTAITGAFKRGEVVEVRGRDGTLIGVGITNFSSAELASIKGLRSPQIMELKNGVLPNRVIDNDQLVRVGSTSPRPWPAGEPVKRAS